MKSPLSGGLARGLVRLRALLALLALALAGCGPAEPSGGSPLPTPPFFGAAEQPYAPSASTLGPWAAAGTAVLGIALGALLGLAIVGAALAGERRRTG